MIVKIRYKHIARCDGCGTELAAEDDYLDAVAAMKRAGWAMVRPDTPSGEWFYLCPVCKAKRKG